MGRSFIKSFPLFVLTLFAANQLQANDQKGIVLFSGYPLQDRDYMTGIDDTDVVGTELFQEWKDIEPNEGEYNWNLIDQTLDLWGGRGKFVDLRIVTSNSYINVTPAWVFDNYDIQRVVPGKFTNFNGSSGEWTTGIGTSITGNALSLSTPGTIISYTNSTNYLTPHARYTIQFNAIIPASGSGAIVLTTATGGSGATQTFPFAAPLTENNVVSDTFILGPYSDYQLSVQWNGPGTLTIDNLNLIRTHNAADDFEVPSTMLEPAPTGCGTVTHPNAPQGTSAWYASNSSSSYKKVFRTDPNQLPLLPNNFYRIVFDVHALTDTEINFRYTTDSGGSWGNRYDNYWFIKAGQSRKIEMVANTGNYSDYTIQLGLDGLGELLIDRFEVTDYNQREVEFPNYFDPVFKNLYANFIQEVGDRYADHPALHSVSVGPCGRWDEVMLSGDTPGVVNDQWYGYGYTDTAFMDHLVWAFDLYETNFPNKDLQIQLAYGLHGVTSEDWMYRRLAGIAAERGIMLKQNGMSERYDTWGNPGYPSWSFNRYPELPKIHETGGQMYNNGYNAMGHPISLINRALMNDADYLYFYSVDIGTRSLNRFFHAGIEQAGNSMPTKFYNRLGHWQMENDQYNGNIDYYNFWHGLWLTDTDGNNPENFVEIAGEKAATTANFGGNMYFDIDDRARYKGMSGATLSVQYYDQGTDNFTTSYFNDDAYQWVTLGTTTKTNTLTWKTQHYYLGDALTIKRNSGIDPLRDIRIADNYNGAETIRNIEINFAPTHSQNTSLSINDEISSNFTPVAGILTRTFELSPFQPPSMVRIPLYTNRTYTESSVVGSLYGWVNGTKTLLAEKEYDFPWDKEYLEIPVNTPTNTTQFEAQLHTASGSVGWYQNPEGTLALQVLSPNTPATWPENNAQPVILTTSFTESMIVPETYCGIFIQTSGSGFYNAIIHRDIGGGVYQQIASQVFNVTQDEQVVLLHTGNQPASSIQVELYHLNGNIQINPLGDGTYTHPWAVQTHGGNSPRSKVPGTDIARWQLTSRPSLNSWSTQGNRLPGTDTLNFLVDGINPVLESPSGLNMATRPTQSVGFRMKNQTGAGLAKISWRNNSQSFTPANSIYIPLVPNDTEYRDYYVTTGLEDGWTGNIDQIRIEPVAGLFNNGTIEIESIAITDKLIIHRWDFDDTADMLFPFRAVKSVDIIDGNISIIPRNGNAMVTTPQNIPNFDANSGIKMRITLKNETNGTSLTMGWRRKNSGYSGSRSVNISNYDTDYKTYELNPQYSGDWYGNIIQVYLKPSIWFEGNDPLLIDSMEIYQDPVTITLPENNFEGWIFQ